jgi:hypothetical protein
MVSGSDRLPVSRNGANQGISDFGGTGEDWKTGSGKVRELGRVSLSRLTLSRLTLSRLTLSRLTLSRLTLSRLTLSRLTLSRLTLSRLTLLPNKI